MCDDNCEKFSPDRIRCESCRTINLARVKEHKPNMQMYDKCQNMSPPCIPVSEMPVTPTCIKVCNKEEYFKCTCKQPVITIHPPIGHGKLMYAVKAALLAGTLYWTYAQGIWGDQLEVTECMRRWTEYSRSFTSRRPPTFDKCGKVVYKETTDTLTGPLYVVYKTCVTALFSGAVKFPMILKCTYIKYQKDMQNRNIPEAQKKNKT